MIPGAGTCINTATVLVGATIGLLAGRRFPERFRRTITHVLGLITFFIAARMMTRIEGGFLIHVVVALLVGTILGELLKIEQGIEWLGARLRDRFAAKRAGDQTTFVKGFVVAGGVMILGIGLLLLDVVRIRVANLLPALPLVCLILWLWPKAIG